MRLTQASNNGLVIQSRAEAEFPLVQAVASRMVEDSDGVYALASEDPFEGWVHVTAVWDTFQRKDLVADYAAAKRAEGVR